MKNRILYIVFSILFVCCIASHNMTNHEIPCDEERWEVLSGSVLNGTMVAEQEHEGRVLETAYYTLDQDVYTVTVNYLSTAPEAVLVVEMVDQPFMTVPLPVSEELSTIEIPVSLDRDYGDFRIYVEKSPGGVLMIKEIKIHSEKPVNNDYTCLAVITALVLAGLYDLIFINRKRIAPETVFSVLLLAAACILISAPMFRTGIYHGDDLDYHAYKIRGMRDAMKNGQFPVYIFPYVFGGYGYPNVVYPSFFLYPSAFLRILGVSTMTCYKLMMFAVNLGTGWIAWWSAEKLLGRQHKGAALLFALLYLMAPYRINNLWVRAAVGELLAMMFLPLILLGLYELLIGDRKKWWYLAAGYSGLIQSHVLSCLMILIFSVLLGIFYADTFFKEKRWIELLKVIGCLLAFNAWYLIPFLLYMRLDLNLAGLHMDWHMHTMDLAEVFQSYVPRLSARYTWRSNSLGLTGMFCLLLGLTGMLTKGEKNRKQKFLSVLFMCGVLFTLLTTNMVPWELLRQVTVIDWIAETMQFPWRFLAFSSLCLSLVGVGWLYESELLKRYRPLVGSVMVLSLALSVWDVVNYTGSDGVFVPSDRPLVKLVREYVMVGSDHSDYKRKFYLSDEEKVEVVDFELGVYQSEISLVCKEERQYIEAPMFNYPGYKAFDKDGARLPVEIGSNNRVRVLLSPSEQVQEITVRFAGEDSFLVGYGVTLVAVLWALGYVNRERLRRWMKKRRQPS